MSFMKAFIQFYAFETSVLSKYVDFQKKEKNGIDGVYETVIPIFRFLTIFLVPNPSIYRFLWANCN